MTTPIDGPPRLEQFNAAYDAMQDRVLLRIRTSDGAEYRFWITRRYLFLLWPILMKMADGFSARKTTDPLVRSTLAELAHGEAVGKADFSSQYQDGTLFPLGTDPVLLAKISLRPLAGETQTLVLLPNDGQGVNLDLDERLVHILARLLQQTATAAEWGLKLEVTPGFGMAEPASDATRRLH
ncbi:MAG: hypothetical protein HZA62_13625 [Rhodocyclales bacterium]|nr:hypothetical protein [Rhodocyclales bacterium]